MQKLWDLKKKLGNNNMEVPSAKYDLKGNLITSRADIKRLYKDVYSERLKCKEIMPKHEEIDELKTELFNSNYSNLINKKSKNWDMESLERAIGGLKTRKAMDPFKMTCKI